MRDPSITVIADTTPPRATRESVPQNHEAMFDLAEQEAWKSRSPRHKQTLKAHQALRPALPLSKMITMLQPAARIMEIDGFPDVRIDETGSERQLVSEKFAGRPRNFGDAPRDPEHGTRPPSRC
jgi:hypothetical protein